VYARVERELTTVPVALRQLLQEADAIVERVYFPVEGFCSILTLLRDGQMIEVATIGREGASGALGALEGVTTPTATMVQGKMDACLAMPAEAFRREMDLRGPFHGLLTHYTHTLVSIAMQSTACNAVHSIEQRLARWLLAAANHMESDEFDLTQEFAAMMLGASRQTVTLAAGVLQKAGALRYRRGRVTIIDRATLEELSCECYGTIVNLLRRGQPMR
jgi:CRP-like cAMP-binding protein